jgi:phosphosulfolactate phosphohydrolase-like enzyme
LCHALREFAPHVRWTDSASFTADLFTANSTDLLSAMQKSSNAVRLLSAPDLAGDVDYCLTANLHPLVVTADTHGWLHRVEPG